MEILRIGICDDETVDLDQVLSLLYEYDRERRFQTMTFFSAGKLFEENDAHPFDIVILDIEMEPPTGFEIAKKLIGLPNPPTIIFVTKSNAYAMKGYGVAIRYLQKPITKADFTEAMDAAIMDASAHRLTFEMDGSLVALYIRDICYVEVFGHYSIIHTHTKDYRIRSTLKEIAAKLPRQYFAAPHKSYVVNLEHIQSATATEIQMDSGSVVPISRSKAQDFNCALYAFLGR